MTISIIIPTFNEEENIAAIIGEILKRDSEKLVKEIFISDGQSADNTINIASNAGVLVVESPKKGRAAQMNYGSTFAKSDILYFLHADSIPPKDFSKYILNAVQNNFVCGCFRLSFDHDHWFLRANAWFTRFDINAVRFGDQSLFVTKEVFEKAGGFREDLLMMEDQEIIHRLKKFGKFTVLDDVVTTSARKYIDNGIFRMQRIFYRIWAMYYLGYSQQRMLKVYKRLVRKHKL